jgi:hypothetical protein
VRRRASQDGPLGFDTDAKLGAVALAQEPAVVGLFLQARTTHSLIFVNSATEIGHALIGSKTTTFGRPCCAAERARPSARRNVSEHSFE